MKKIILLSLLCVLDYTGFAQKKGKRIKSSVDYLHESTMTKFPTSFKNYERASIHSYEKDINNLGVTYKSQINNATVVVYIYPAGSGFDSRLRNEYQKSMQFLVSSSWDGIAATQYAVKYEKDKYKINGFRADINNLPRQSSIIVYECGEWFFKIKITNSSTDSSLIDSIESEILEQFNPVNLVKLSSLNSKADIHFSKLAFVDSLMLGCTMGSAYAKLEWAIDNVDSLELASGFPDMYFDLILAGLKGSLKFDKEHPNWDRTPYTNKYLKYLNRLNENGFLEEFIMDETNMVMIFPASLEDQYETYKLWLKSNPKEISLNTRFYYISFSKK
jgi:hypothetical protein